MSYIDECFRNVVDDSQVESSEYSVNEEEANRSDERKLLSLCLSRVCRLLFVL